MRKHFKCISSIALSLALVTTSVFAGANLGTKNVAKASSLSTMTSADVETPDNPQRFTDLNSDQMIEAMGTGWNLGNTFDGHTGMMPSETSWQTVATTKKLIKEVHDKGFNTIRIPCTWGKKITEKDGKYVINETWLSRIQDVVDYAVEQNMYVIINIHHDGANSDGWLKLKSTGDGLQKVFDEYESVWTTLATRFKNYNEHLIFEALNEPQSGSWDSSEANKAFGENLNKANQIFVDTVRKSGGNNANRWLMVTPWGTNIAKLISNDSGFVMPTDTRSESRLMVSVHNYAPTNKCLDGSPRDQNDISLLDVKNCYKASFETLNEMFISKGIPVVLGEYGAVDKDNNGNRALYTEGLNYLAKQNKVVPVYWDDGGIDNNAFALFDRTECARRTGYEEISKALTRGFFNTTDFQSIPDRTTAENPAITKITSFDLSDSEVSMECNTTKTITTKNVTPETNDDVILWKSDDALVASVYNGVITARGIGTTTITAYSQEDESVVKTVKVTVTKESAVDGKQPTLMYKSSDESVATVSTTGKVVGISLGTAVITVTASTGEEKEIPVKIAEAKWDATKLRAKLYVYYQDSKFYENVGSTDEVTITGDGTYNLKFDCDTDLPESAAEAGVSTLRDFGAIYIKEADVDDGLISRSVIKKGKIHYNSIKVNGKELTITDPNNSKNAVGSNKVFDTGNPLNAWDGCVVDTTDGLVSVDTSNYRINFPGIENPKTIEVNFTLSNLINYDKNPFGTPLESTGEDTVVLPTVTKKCEAIKTSVEAVEIDQEGHCFLNGYYQKASTQTTVAPSTQPTVAPSQTPAASVQPSQKPAASVQPSQKPVVKKTTKNACTKVKAKKTKVTVKKGKKATLKFKVTAKNKKAKTTDKMKVSVKNKKIVTVSKKKLSKGSATVTVKGKKKGSTKVTVKIGKKSAKVTVKVK